VVSVVARRSPKELGIRAHINNGLESQAEIHNNCENICAEVCKARALEARWVEAHRFALQGR